jgi:hypothetical protein
MPFWRCEWWQHQARAGGAAMLSRKSCDIFGQLAAIHHYKSLSRETKIFAIKKARPHANGSAN